MQSIFNELRNITDLEEKSCKIADIAAIMHVDYDVSVEEVKKLFRPLFNPFLFKDKGITYMLETEDQYEYLQNIIDEAVCRKIIQQRLNNADSILQEGINDSNRRLKEIMEYPDYLEEM